MTQQPQDNRRTPKSASAVTKAKRKEGGVGDTIRVVLQTLLIALVIRTLFFQAFRFRPGSMKATLLSGTICSSLSSATATPTIRCHFRRRCFPAEYFASEPKRGDVVVFTPAEGRYYRLHQAGHWLAGRPHQNEGRLLTSTAKPVKCERVKDFLDDENAGERVRRWRETLPNGVTYQNAGSPGTTDFLTIHRNTSSRPAIIS